MKNQLLAALGGAVILFVWQFMSYGLLDLHYTQMAHTPKQDEIMDALVKSGIKEGEYYMIRAPKGDTDEQNRLMEDRLGKPWAMIQYHDALDHPFALNMVRAIIINMAACLLLTWLLMQFAVVNVKKAIIASVAVGLIVYCTSNYLDAIWFQSNSLPDIIDAVVPWIGIGAWMGWLLKKEF